MTESVSTSAIPTMTNAATKTGTAVADLRTEFVIRRTSEFTARLYSAVAGMSRMYLGFCWRVFTRGRNPWRAYPSRASPTQCRVPELASDGVARSVEGGGHDVAHMFAGRR